MNTTIAWKYAQRKKPCFHIFVDFGSNLSVAIRIYGNRLTWTNKSMFCPLCGERK